MNENAQKWVEALRSGKYNQTFGHLADAYGHCCLGVACEVAIENGVPIVKRDYFYNNENNLLPVEVRNWLGFRLTNGEWNRSSDYTPCVDFCALTTANDRGLTFEEIADLIESEPEGLFK